MPKPQIDTDALAKTLAQRIRAAARTDLNEARLSKTASDSSRKQRVIRELVRIKGELNALDLEASDRADAERKAGEELRVPGKFGQIIKEASIDALGTIGSHWMLFFGNLGI